jgi:hypothetical protein
VEPLLIVRRLREQIVILAWMRASNLTLPTIPTLRPKLLVLLEHMHLQERPSASAFRGKPLGRGTGFLMQDLGLDPGSAVPDAERAMVPSSRVLPPRPGSTYKAHD